ncbi:MAG: PKD domain-containing protein [Candidatus Peribacteraceae bacterium]|nr:PKD domain-containing protein [Candidatus Peribacteraceae bacterium]
MSSSSRLRLATTSTAISLTLMTFAVLQAHAQGVSETITTPLGAVFEIMAETQMANAQYGWILTKNQEFLGAERTKTFRTRFTDPGTYLLNAEVSGGDPMNPLRERRTISIVVSDAANLPTSETETSADTFVIANPPIDRFGRIVLSRERSVVTFQPARESPSTFLIDLDVTRDSNGDGDPENDNDAPDTFFSSHGDPLVVWFSSAILERSIRVTVQLPDGNTHAQDLRVVNEDVASREDEQLLKAIEIVSKPTGSGSVQLKVTYPKGAPQSPVLIHWAFGDGGQSLLDEPEHLYPTNGNYTVTVSVRDLTTGQVIESGSTLIVISSFSVTGSDSSTGTVIDNGETGGGISFALLFRILGIGALSLLAGFIVIFLISKLSRKGSSLASTLAAAEEKLTGAAPTDVIAPLQIIDAQEVAKSEPGPVTKAPSEPKREDLKTSVAPQQESKQMPDWLRPTQAKKEEPAPSTPPPSSPVPVPPPTPPAPHKPAASAPEGPVPDWLKPKPAPATAPTPPSQSLEKKKEPPPPPAPPKAVPEPPKPTPPPIQKPPTPSKPAETPAQTQDKGSGPVPPWLQPKPAAPKQEAMKSIESEKKEQLAQASAPALQPKTPEPATPKPVSAPQPLKPTPPFTPPPTAEKKPQQSTPAQKRPPPQKQTPPKPVQQPKPPAKAPVQSSPEKKPQPPKPAPEKPKPQQQQAPKQTELKPPAEEPIMFIRADSLSPDEGAQPPSGTPKKSA